MQVALVCEADRVRDLGGRRTRPKERPGVREPELDHVLVGREARRGTKGANQVKRGYPGLRGEVVE
jgi:hypothetical protein